MIDYTIYYREKLAPDADLSGTADLLVSAYNSSERVQAVFAQVGAQEKHWLVHPEYEYSPSEHPTDGRVFAPPPGDEAEFLSFYFDQVRSQLVGARVCVDSTGFMRPHLMLLMQFLRGAGVRKFDVLYSEPGQYVKQEQTQFSKPPVLDVRPVLGFEGTHVTDTSRDLLIVGSGYDHPLIAQAAEHKKSARKVQMLGFPSLRPDMFQENVLMAHYAEEAIGSGGLRGTRDYFAPANDPFVVASVVQSIVALDEADGGPTNLYLCPLATKPQAIGFALYFLSERVNTATSMIYPFPRSYARETSAGLSRIWKYTVELPE